MEDGTAHDPPAAGRREPLRAPAPRARRHELRAQPDRAAPRPARAHPRPRAPGGGLPRARGHALAARRGRGDAHERGELVRVAPASAASSSTAARATLHLLAIGGAGEHEGRDGKAWSPRGTRPTRLAAGDAAAGGPAGGRSCAAGAATGGVPEPVAGRQQGEVASKNSIVEIIDSPKISSGDRGRTRRDAEHGGDGRCARARSGGGGPHGIFAAPIGLGPVPRVRRVDQHQHRFPSSPRRAAGQRVRGPRITPSGCRRKSLPVGSGAP